MTKKIDNLREKLASSIEKYEKKICTMIRHDKQLKKKIAKLSSLSGVKDIDLSNLDQYKWDENRKPNDYYWEVCEVESKLRDIKSATRNIEDAKRIMDSWGEKLDKELAIVNKIENDIPQVIKDFVQQWKESAYAWHVKRYADYLVFANNLDEEAEAYSIKIGVQKGRMPNREQKKLQREQNLDYASVRERKNRFGGAIVMKMLEYRWDEKGRLDYLDNVLEVEKQAKIIDLINRIQDITGTIVDASKLEISAKGNIDGIVKGEKGSAKVQTVSAGGWNIQCFHYRILVHQL